VKKLVPAVFLVAGMAAMTAGAVRALGFPGDNPANRPRLFAHDSTWDNSAPANAVAPSPPNDSRPKARRASAGGRRYFLVTEAGVRKIWMPTTDHMDQYIFLNNFGLMKRIAPRRAVGGSVDMTLALGEIKFAPTVRYKHWLEKAGSLDFSFGYIADNKRGAVGPVLNARYSPGKYFYVEAGLCQIEVGYERAYYFPHSPYPPAAGRPRLNGYLGAGFTGGAGALVWAAEATGIGLLILMFSGMD
jgi:hypothetical protein